MPQRYDEDAGSDAELQEPIALCVAMDRRTRNSRRVLAVLTSAVPRIEATDRMGNSLGGRKQKRRGGFTRRSSSDRRTVALTSGGRTRLNEVGASREKSNDGWRRRRRRVAPQRMCKLSAARFARRLEDPKTREFEDVAGRGGKSQQQRGPGGCVHPCGERWL
jgi:hypothetical protein